MEGISQHKRKRLVIHGFEKNTSKRIPAIEKRFLSKGRLTNKATKRHTNTQKTGLVMKSNILDIRKNIVLRWGVKSIWVWLL